MSAPQKPKSPAAPHSDNAKVSEIILASHNELAKDITSRMHASFGEMLEQYGVEPEKMFEYMFYKVSYLANAIANANTGLFTEYVDWEKSLFESKKISVDVHVKTLEVLQESLIAGLPPETHKTINAFIRAGFDEIKGSCVKIQPFIDSAAAHGVLAQQYLDATLAGDRPAANRLVMEAFSGGVSIRDIYLHVLQPVQYEVGRLWQTNRITVAQEHFASGVTQMIMSQLYYPHICNVEKTGKTMVAICVSGELHEIGLRMVSDLFEMEGWHVCLLGANMPAYDIVESLLKHKAAVLGISAAMASSVNKAESIIERVKTSEASKTSIMVGGYAFNRDAQLWSMVGADYYAKDAQSALQITRKVTV